MPKLSEITDENEDNSDISPNLLRLLPTNFYIAMDFSIVNESGVKSPVFLWVNLHDGSIIGLHQLTRVFSI